MESSSLYPPTTCFAGVKIVRHFLNGFVHLEQEGALQDFISTMPTRTMRGQWLFDPYEYYA